MGTETIELEVIIPATPEDVFNAWLDSATHAAFTGSEATGDAEVGAPFTAWDGYIRGTNVALEAARRIVQTWRTTEFPEDHPDSRVEVLLEEHPQGAVITLLHTEIPQGQAENYRQGWTEYYFEPLTKYFGGGSRDDGKPAPRKKAAAKKKKKTAPRKKAAAKKTKKQAAPRKKKAVKKKAPAKKKKKTSRRP